MKVIVLNSKEEIGIQTSKIMIEEVKNKSDTIFGLATGSSPITTYEAIIGDHQDKGTDWSKVKTFNLDEYVGLSPDHNQSYRHFMNVNLFDHINIDKKNTFIPTGVGDYEGFASKYDDLIAEHGGIDVQLLGLGTNGHIGFNEPPVDFESKTSVVDLVESTIEANSRFFQSINEVPKKAVSMGIQTIMKAKKIILIANGKSKATAIKQLIEGNVDKNWPCTILQKHKNLTIIIDDEASSLLLKKY
ncbi:glucosamine-6-phosphate deaminase [Spiroplasma endosymbiont of Amphibalanus improvisus]|uniref:glucosamine-6-phosphate deaminase n=1 Tax=Spiroplasma endosymbiont of Amphibalanus improvisus TaxID=3066327 RepID=UPI00313BED18